MLFQACTISNQIIRPIVEVKIENFSDDVELLYSNNFEDTLCHKSFYSEKISSDFKRIEKQDVLKPRLLFSETLTILNLCIKNADSTFNVYSYYGFAGIDSLKIKWNQPIDTLIELN